MAVAILAREVVLPPITAWAVVIGAVLVMSRRMAGGFCGALAAGSGFAKMISSVVELKANF
jgi:hypothetical protein